MFNKNEKTIMNKKIYIQPSVEYIKIETTLFLAASLPITNSVTPTPGTTLSREFDFEFDEEGRF